MHPDDIRELFDSFLLAVSIGLNVGLLVVIEDMAQCDRRETVAAQVDTIDIDAIDIRVPSR